MEALYILKECSKCYDIKIDVSALPQNLEMILGNKIAKYFDAKFTACKVQSKVKLSLIISKQIMIMQLSIIVFMLLSFGMGNFIPLNEYPISYASIINVFPITALFKNIQAIIINSSIQWSGLILTLAR